MVIPSPPDWQITTEPDQDRTLAILIACRCCSQAAFESLYASTSPAARPPLSYCLYLAATVSHGPTLVSCILGCSLSSTRIHDYIVLSIFSSIAAGDTAVLQTFLDAGLDQNFPLESSHDRVDSLLERAVTSNQMTMARFLLSRGADANGEPLESMAIHCTMVSYADSFNLPGMVRLLISEEGGGRLVGSWALWRAAKRPSIDVAEALLDLGADINELFIRPLNRRARASENYGTALHAAVLEDRLEFVKWLLQKGIDPQLKNGHGSTAAELAMKKAYSEIREVLVTWKTNHDSAIS